MTKLRRPRERPLPKPTSKDYIEHLKHFEHCKWCKSDHEWLAYYRIYEIMEGKRK